MFSVPYVRPGRFFWCLSENRGCSPYPTGIPTTRAFYGGGSVSLRVSHPKCSSFVIRSVRPYSLWPPSARAPCPGCSRPTLPPKGYLQPRQRSSWFLSTCLLDSSNHRQWRSRSHIRSRSNRIESLHELVTPSVAISLSVSSSWSG